MTSLAGSNLLAKWQDRFHGWIDRVDAQHQQLLTLINDLWDAAARDRSSAQLMRHIDRLMRYASDRFSEEEQAMQAAGYPQLAEHRKAHQHFIDRVIAEKRKAMTDGYAALDLLRFLQEWLADHIAVQDRHSTAYVLDNTRHPQRTSLFKRLQRHFA